MNLKDRMNSGSQGSDPNRARPIPSSENTTSKSMLPSPEQDLLKEQSETIQKLSSENLGLRNELQNKSETIVSLNEQIEKLSGSDLVLEQNEQLKKINEQLRRNEQNVRNEAAASISAVKQEYETKQYELDSKLRLAEMRESDALDLKKNFEAKISTEAKRLTSAKLAMLQQEYDQKSADAKNRAKGKIAAVHSLTTGALVYGIFATVLTAFKSPRCSADILVFMQIIWLFLSSVFNLAVTAASATWTLNEHIPYRIVAVIVAGALTAIVFTLIAVAIYGTTTYIAYRICKFYKRHFWDLPSLVEVLVSMGIIVWFADYLSVIKWNLVAVWLLIHLLYMIVHSVFVPPKRSNYYY